MSIQSNIFPRHSSKPHGEEQLEQGILLTEEGKPCPVEAIASKMGKILETCPGEHRSLSKQKNRWGRALQLDILHQFH